MALASTLVPLGVELAGAAASRLFADRPETPNIVRPATEEVENQQRELRENLAANTDELEADLAARGVTGSGGSTQRQDIFESAASAGAELNARAADIISDAVQRQRMLEFRNQRQEARNRAQGITSLASGISSGLQQDELLSELGDEESLLDRLFGSGSGSS